MLSGRTFNGFIYLFREKDDEIANFRQQYEELKRDHLKLIDNNDDLNHDIEAAARHLDLLTVQNHEVRYFVIEIT